MKRTSMLALACFLVVGPLLAQDRGPATAEERETAVTFARMLENDPLGPQAKDARKWLTVWLIAVPDITISVCGDLLGPVPRSAKKYASELVMQAAYSGVAFIIEHPDQAQDSIAVYNAGIEGALKAYAGIKAQQPKYVWPFLDELREKQAQGTLEAHVISAAQKCAS